MEQSITILFIVYCFDKSVLLKRVTTKGQRKQLYQEQGRSQGIAGVVKGDLQPERSALNLIAGDSATALKTKVRLFPAGNPSRGKTPGQMKTRPAWGGEGEM